MQKRGMKERLLRLTAGFCAALCLFSAVMTGTYAWQSEQHATNDLWGTADTLIPVELTKLEMSPSGRPTEIPVEGAVFYLYKMDGTQIGVQYVTDKNGKINVQLVPGKYYFEETMPPYGYTYPLNERGEPVTRHEFEVKEQEEPYETVEVLVYNRRLSGDLVISKVVQNSDGTPLTDEQRQMAFTFIVTFADGTEITEVPDFASPTDPPVAGDGTSDEEQVYTYYVNNGPTQTIVSGGMLQLYSGDTAVFEGLPAGMLYNVVEKPVEGYVTTSTGHQGNIREEETAQAMFVNTYQAGDTGTLVITKKAENSDGTPLTDAQKAMDFTFSLTLGEVTEEFTLKSGEKKSFHVPVGTDYLVRELTEENSSYTPLMDTYSGTIAVAEAVYLPFINVYEGEVPPQENGTLVVTKTVTGGEADDTKYFTIAVTFQGKDAPEGQVILLQNEQSHTIENIPHGVTYTVMEADAAGYVPAWEIMQGTIIGGKTAEVEVVNIVPEPEDPEPPVPPESVTLTVKKMLEGNVLPSDYKRLFNMTLYINGQKAETFSLLPVDPTIPTEDLELAEKQIRIITIPYGYTYELREENYFSAGFSQNIVNGSGTATADTEVIVTNTYIGEPRVEISGEKSWVIPEGVNITLPESITVRLMDGDKVVEEKVVTPQAVEPDGEEKWLYTFIAPQNRADGTEIVYTIEEEPIDHFYTTYDGYNIVNTYVAPVTEDDPPITIRKKVIGTKAPEVEFTFVFESRTAGAPMPEGVTGSKMEFRLLSGQEIEIGKITFTKEGEYTYAVYEKNDGKKDWSYDTATYTINYLVTRDENTHQLSVVRTIKKNSTETASNEMVFTNAYEPEDEGKVLISGVKTWVHRSNPVQNRPTSIVIEVYGDGKRVYQQQLTAADGWRYSLSLDKYAADGHEIVYTVDEQAVSGYTKTIDGYNITNKYKGTTPTPGPKPDTPDKPDKPDEKPDSSDTGDNSRIPFWLMMMLASMLATIASVRALRATAYVGKRLPAHQRRNRGRRLQR